MASTYKYIARCFFLGVALTCGPVAAQVQGLEVKRAGDISYVSGGVGAHEQEALKQVESNYNLRLLFAVSGTGAFLAEIAVTIANPSGQILLEAVSDGPYFYAKVPAGTYQVSAAHAGRVQRRSVRVPATGAASEDFRWPPE